MALNVSIKSVLAARIINLIFVDCNHVYKFILYVYASSSVHLNLVLSVVPGHSNPHFAPLAQIFELSSFNHLDYFDIFTKELLYFVVAYSFCPLSSENSSQMFTNFRMWSLLLPWTQVLLIYLYPLRIHN